MDIGAMRTKKRTYFHWGSVLLARAVLLARGGILASALVVLAGVVGRAEGAPLPLPPSQGQLAVERVTFVAEYVPIDRFVLTGSLNVHADPVSDFILLDRPGNGSLLHLRHVLFPHAFVQMFLYPNRGQTAFGDERWNEFLSDRMALLGGEIEARITQPFVDKPNSGPPILGFTSLSAAIEFVDPRATEAQAQLFLIAPVSDSPFVVVFTLFCDARHLPTLRPLFYRFASNLFIPAGN